MESHKLPGEIVVDGIHLPGKYITMDILEKVKGIRMSEKDTLIVGYPKSGNTWMSEIVYLIHTEVNIDAAKSDFQMNRVPFLELGDSLGSSCPIDTVAVMPSPRIMKTHLPFQFYQNQMLEDKVKTIVIMRNPKDILVSYYYMYKAHKVLGNFAGTWDQFYEMFCSKKLCYGDWFQINNSWWEQRHLPNILIVKYEDLKMHFEDEVNKLAKFMGRKLSQENMKLLKEHVKFTTMQKNSFVNPSNFHETNISKLIRKGIIGDWKNHFTVAQNKMFEKMYMPQIEESGMEFIFE